MNVTILSDASWCPETFAGGWGSWAVSDRKDHGDGGPLKKRLASSNDAEMAAVVNALHVAYREGVLHDGDDVLIQIDCVGAIRQFQGPRHGVTDPYHIVEEFHRFKREHRLAITFKHVKGHTGRTEARYLANKMCDKRAKRGMREARRLIQKETGSLGLAAQ